MNPRRYVSYSALEQLKREVLDVFDPLEALTLASRLGVVGSVDVDVFVVPDGDPRAGTIETGSADGHLGAVGE